MKMPIDANRASLLQLFSTYLQNRKEKFWIYFFLEKAFWSKFENVLFFDKIVYFIAWKSMHENW